MEEKLVQEELPQSQSPYEVLQHISGEAVRVAGEAIQNVVSSPKVVPSPVAAVGHRRTQSEIVHKRHNSLQRLKSHVQKAFRWGGNSKERSYCIQFNPEILANQKRQWYQLHSKTSDHKNYKEPTSLFEHFIIVGLHPDANLEVVEDAFAKRKRWELQVGKSELLDKQGKTISTLEPQILFKYPPGKRLAMRLRDLAAFCFPEDVKARVIERTPSLSELNKLVYGQEHLSRDDLAFIFSFKVADNATLYGVCLNVQEFVQRPPAILGASSPLSQPSGGHSRFLVSAPRCYCVLTRVPFFELHYEMINSIIAQERLNRIMQFVSEMTLADTVSSVPKLNDQTNENSESPHRECAADLMASAIPVDSAVALTAAAAGIISDDFHSSSSRWEPHSPESYSASEVSDQGQHGRHFFHCCDDCSSEASESRCDGSERMNGNYDNGLSPEFGAFVCPRRLESVGSSESLFSGSVRSAGSEDEDDEMLSSNEKVVGDEMILEWARENKNDLLQVVCRYHAMPLPPRGTEIVFQPLQHLQAIRYKRPPVSDLGISEEYLNLKMKDSQDPAEVNLKLAAAEEAVALSIWTTATTCRSLSLENVLVLIAGVLLEKQLVVVCPNLGVLSATVISIMPMIRPFEWQSLFLPVLPEKMQDFLDAPVPFIVGILHKPVNLKMKTSNIIQVNVVKDQVKMCSLPALPRHKELITELRPIHARLSCEKSTAKRHPIYRCNEVQAEAATEFLTVMRRYLESLCADMRSHTITSVQSGNDRVSILLKESFIDAFPNKDQPFMKLLVETQLFSVLSDTRLSFFENGY
ncbi:hypothetical protein LguiA_020572 [Lonicera macranthoides]